MGTPIRTESSPPVAASPSETSPMSAASSQSLLPVEVAPALHEDEFQPSTVAALPSSPDAALEPSSSPSIVESPPAVNSSSSIQDFLQDLTGRLAAELGRPSLADNGAEAENMEFAQQGLPVVPREDGSPEEINQGRGGRQVTAMLVMNSSGGGPSVALLLDSRPSSGNAQSRVTDEVLRQILSLVMPRLTHKHLAADAIDATFPVQPCTAELSDVCTVCMSDIEIDDPCRVLECGHVFHADCIDEWLTGESSGNACDTDLCPNCRAPVVVKSIGDAQQSAKPIAEDQEDEDNIPELEDEDSDDMMLPDLEDDMMIEEVEEVGDEEWNDEFEDEGLIRHERPIARRAWELPETTSAAAASGEELSTRGSQQSGSPSHVTDMATWLT